MFHTSKSRNHNIGFYFLRQLLASLISGAAVFFVAYKSNPDPKAITHKVAEIFSDVTNVYILFGFFMTYLASIFVRKHVVTTDETLRHLGELFFGVVKKLASNYESLLHVVIGLMLFFLYLWYRWERQTFNLLLACVYLLFALGMLLMATYFDEIDDQQ